MFTNLVPSKTKVWKAVAVVIFLLSLYGNYKLFRMNYNVSCNVNGEVVGHFTSKVTCDRLLTNFLDSAELSRVHSLQTND